LQIWPPNAGNSAAARAVETNAADDATSSCRASTYAQSVCETLEVDFLLILGCLSHRDNPYVIIPFSVGDDYNRTLQHPQCDEPLFSIVKTIILKHEGYACKHC